MIEYLLDKIRKLFGYKYPRMGKINSVFFRIIPSTLQTDLFRGIKVKLNLKDLTQRSTYWQGSRYEYPTPKILEDWGNSNATKFFDIGSNYGFFSYWMLSSCPNITVYAFEPNPTIVTLMESVKARNNLQRLNIFSMGLGDKNEILDLYIGEKDSAQSGFLENPQSFHTGKKKGICIKTFDEWRKENNIAIPSRPEWVGKIDVEGFEVRVLNGMKEALSSKSFIGICIEILEENLVLCGNKPDDIIDIMKTHNYYVLKVKDNKKTENLFFTPIL